MISDIPLLDNIQVAAPCKAAWEHMEGDDRTRFCCECSKNVYNFSAMSRKEAEELIRKHEGRLCVRYYQRADGTILTDNCPVGLRALRNLFVKRVAVGASLMAVLCNCFLGVTHKFRREPVPSQVNMGSFTMDAVAERQLTDLDKDGPHAIPAVQRDPFIHDVRVPDAPTVTMGTPLTVYTPSRRETDAPEAKERNK